MESKNEDTRRRERAIYSVTLGGAIINVVLTIFKFVAGLLGHSSAMIADAVHSLSDLASDVVVVVFVRLSSKPQDTDHDYGHGKYETLASAIMGLALMGVGVMICLNGASKVWTVINGGTLQQPGVLALVAALLSIALKEWAYQFTARTGRRVGSEAVIANAWHHRSDALSSIGTGIGIGGAILLGPKWAVLDPLAAIIVSFFIVRVAWKLISNAVGELTEKSLSASIEKEIEHIALSEPMVSGLHNLRTRSIGSKVCIDMHMRMPGDMSLYEAHRHTTEIENKLRERFGADSIITPHVEPLKVNGKYEKPEA